MSGKIAVFVYRIQWESGTYWGTSRQVTGGQGTEVFGVATRPVRETIPGAGTREQFEENLNEHATEMQWFDEPMET